MSGMKFYEFEDMLHGLSFDENPEHIVHELIDETRDYHQEITLRPSGLVEFLDNSLAWATKQILNVQFPSSYSTIFGDICHSSADYCYTHLIRHGTIPPLEKALIAGIKKGRNSYYKFLPEKLRDKNLDDYRSLLSIYKEAKVLFSIYYDQVIPNQNPTACEQTMSYQIVDESGAPLNIKLKGTFDRMEEGNVVVDMKTSRFSITGEIVSDDKLDGLKQELKEIQLKPKKDEKQIELEDLIKLAKRKPLKSDKQIDIETKIKDSKKVLTLKRSSDNDKTEAEKLLLELGLKLQKEIDNINLTHEQFISSAEHELEEYLNTIVQIQQDKIKALKIEIEPLQSKVDELQYINDCKAAKDKHGKQLAAYALLYLLVYGVCITEARVELLVRRKIKPYVKSYQFNIEEEIDLIIDEIDTILDVIALWRDGTPSRLLFRINPETFRGSDLLESIKSARQQDENANELFSLSSAA